MNRDDARKKYPTLFAPMDNRGATGQFELLDVLPPEDLIGNVYLVPRVGNDWLYIVEAGGRLQFPGGKKEIGEDHLQVIRRELLEEAGAELGDFQFVGAWHMHMKAAEPKFPHLPHPEVYGVVGVGVVNILGSPTNPEGTGETLEVRVAPLEEVVESFRSGGRDDLADLYQLAAEVDQLSSQ